MCWMTYRWGWRRRGRGRNERADTGLVLYLYLLGLGVCVDIMVCYDGQNDTPGAKISAVIWLSCTRRGWELALGNIS